MLARHACQQNARRFVGGGATAAASSAAAAAAEAQRTAVSKAPRPRSMTGAPAAGDGAQHTGTLARRLKPWRG